MPILSIDKIPDWFRKVVKIAIFLLGIVFALVVLVYIASAYSEKNNPPAENINYGITFSPYAAKYLEIDWKLMYLNILDDLGAKYIRIPSYWTSIEATSGNFDFSGTDFMVSEAQKRGAHLIMTVGVKQPRWPECHLPDWARQLSAVKRQEKVLDLIKKVVERYQGNPSIAAWQVENEPMLYPYGDNCYPPDPKFLKQEADLVRSLDTKPVIISETGELAIWVKQMQFSDIFGTTLYRTVWNPVTGYFKYPVTPGFYSLRSNLIRKLFAPNNKKSIVIELQAEPWLPKNDPLVTPVDEQVKIFPLLQMKDNIDFAGRTGFDEIYLWGVEWWYLMKERGQPQYWDYAKELFNG